MVEENKTKWKDHVDRMAENRLPKKIMNYRPIGKRDLGRPRKRWLDDRDRNRHHRVRGAIACLLRNKGWEVHEEVHCISEDDSHRRADIIAINRRQQKTIIIDPTKHMERDINQAHQVALVFLVVIAVASAQFGVSFGAPGFHSPYAYSSSARVQTSHDALISPFAVY
ncbi:hypothetical protein ANN_25590 [Periplaneta americana]|uniref:Uncharacterized protein n=1 Tax=Periplaneta americana TaxID=6978 RepID=A0ABQ8S1N6_PERAM|nr:hypothetical protein ANN_25590 [Periplaneta americana]